MSLRDALNRAQSAAPFEGFQISDFEEGTTSYFGYQSLNGAWLIKRLAAGAVRYAAGDTDYTTAWASRASLTYSPITEA